MLVWIMCCMSKLLLTSILTHEAKFIKILSQTIEKCDKQLVSAFIISQFFLLFPANSGLGHS